jgi:5-carboxymethyl-2-hydroxymuconic-semialdehyde dehydrogenase
MSDRAEENVRKARKHLERFASAPLGHFIDGALRPGVSAETFENRTPIDDSLLGHVSAGGAADVDAAARSAERAFPAWREMPGGERRELLHAIADGIEARGEEIALVESLDTGQPIRFMAAAGKRSAENFRFFADRAPTARNGLALPAAEHVNYTLRQPIGPVAVITPWNTPFMLATWKIAPALAAGCTVVHKPAEWSPLSAVLLAEICFAAGLPAGVLNTVQGLGDAAGKAATAHPALKAVAFVGESATGSLIMAQGAPTLKRVHFELGGKNAVVVFADADWDRALDAVVFMIFSLNGERCTSSSRLRYSARYTIAFSPRSSRACGASSSVTRSIRRPRSDRSFIRGTSPKSYRTSKSPRARVSRYPSAGRWRVLAATTYSRLCSPALIITCASRRKRSSVPC